jgi:glycosyltransferase involved in cell wall biosynthesis
VDASLQYVAKVSTPADLEAPLNSIRGPELNHGQRSAKVSVIIPAYQSVNCIAQALNSVFWQTFTAFEVIVVNDGSPETDFLESILEFYSSRIVYLKQENRGPSGARNTGILHASGKYVAFLDSDDYWLPEHLENQIALLDRDPSLSLVYADCILIKDDVPFGTAFGLEPQSRPVTLDALLEWRCTPGTSSVVASREAIIAAGLFDETIRRCEDFDLWVRMALLGCRMAYQHAPQVCHRRGYGLSVNRVRMKESCSEIYEKLMKVPLLSGAQRAIVERMTTKVHLDYQIENAKVSLLAEDYSDALAAAQMARTLRNSWKLRAAVAGLHAAPRLFRRSYQLYDRLLEFRNRKRNARRVKALALPALTDAVSRLGPQKALASVQTGALSRPGKPSQDSNAGTLAYD